MFVWEKAYRIFETRKKDLDAKVRITEDENIKQVEVRMVKEDRGIAIHSTQCSKDCSMN